MKIFKKILSIMMAICLVAAFIPAMGIVAIAEEGVRIELSNTTVVFDEGTTSCNVPVAVKYSENVDNYTYEIPSVAAVYKSGAAVAYTKVDAQAVPGAITITVDDTTYTLNLVLVGKNMYTNGGFENGAWTGHGAGTTLTQINIKPGQGSYAMNIDRGTSEANSPYRFWWPGEALVPEVNKTYLASSMIRLAEENAEATTLLNSIKKHNGTSTGPAKYNSEATIGYYNADGTKRADDKVDASYNWTTTYATLKVTTVDETTNKLSQTYITGGTQDLVVDEYFFGELAAHINVLDSEENKTRQITSPDADVIIGLSADRVNQLGNKAGLGANPTFTWSLLEGSADGVAVDAATGAVTVKAGAPAGTYKVQAQATSGNDVQTDIKGIFVIEISDKCTLSNLMVSNTDLNFDSTITQYSVPVPVLYTDNVDTYTWEMPVVEATATNSTDEVEIEYPDSIPGNILVKVSDGENLKTYTISLDFAGKNMYTNGGFESGAWTGHGAGTTLTQINIKPGQGIYAMNIDRGTSETNSPMRFWWPDTTLVPAVNKTYLASSMIRLAEENADTASLMNVIRKHDGTSYAPVKYESQAVIGYFNADGTKRADDKVDASYNWTTTYATLKVTEADESKNGLSQVYFLGGTQDLVVDEYFFGELVIADVEFTADKTDIVKSDEAQEVALTAKAINNLGNSAAIKDNYTLSLRLASDAPEGAAIENGVVTIPAGFEGTVTVEAVAVPTWDNAAQKNFVKQYEIGVGVLQVHHTAISGGVNVAVKFLGEAGEYKLINAVYNVLEGGKLELSNIASVPVTKVDGVAFEEDVDVSFAANQVVKTFFWKWNSLNPVANAFEYQK